MHNINAILYYYIHMIVIWTQTIFPSTKIQRLEHQSKLQISINNSVEWTNLKCKQLILRDEIIPTNKWNLIYTNNDINVVDKIFGIKYIYLLIHTYEKCNNDLKGLQ